MRIQSSRRFLAALFICCCFAGLVAAAEPINVAWDELRDVENRPLELAEAKWKVVCFLGTECPLARLYAPRLQRLDEEFSEQGVRLIGINSNPQDSADEIKQYVNELKLSFPVVKDSGQELARMFGAKRTPHVFVLDDQNRVCYQGRIDDQFEPGISRAEPSRRDLHDALAALAAGREPPTISTEPVGCLITYVKEPQPATDGAKAVTFTRDVAPILNRNCVECHRAGEIGPFALTDYDEVVGWGEMMLEVIDQKRMPPWHADPEYGEFVGARHMPEDDRDTLAAWLRQGMPEGDPADLPPAPTWIADWHLDTPPDEEHAMRARPFAVPPDGTVDYQYFVVDPQWEQDRWVRAAQVVPGDAAVVHHSIVFVRPPDGAKSEGIGWLGGYVPGQRSAPLPQGHARRIPAHSKLVFQMHYTPNGKQTDDLTKVGVWFSEPSEVTHEVTTRVALNHHFEIPPGAADHVVRLKLDGFARESRLLGAIPHMHLRGKSFRLDVRDGEASETLLSVPHYDFNWQHVYQFVEPVELANVDEMQMDVRFDNSAGNATNPDPSEFVTWGDQTWQEMAVAFLDIAHPRDKPRIIAQKQKPLSEQAQKERRQRIEQEIDKFLAQLDKNGDGVVVEDETPDAFRRFGFRKIDKNRDGRLERDEVEAEAARRF